MSIHKNRCGSYDPATGLECTHLKGHGRSSNGHDHGIMNTGPSWGWSPEPWQPFGAPLPMFVPNPND